MRSRKPLSEFHKLSRFIRFLPSVRKTVSEISGLYRVSLISSGMDFYVSEVASRLGIECWHANYSLVTDSTGIVCDIRPSAPDDTAKVGILKTLCRKHKLNPDQIAYVGDSVNDLPVFQFTGRGVMVGKGTPELRKASWRHISTIAKLPDILRAAWTG